MLITKTNLNNNLIFIDFIQKFMDENKLTIDHFASKYGINKTRLKVMLDPCKSKKVNREKLLEIFHQFGCKIRFIIETPGYPDRSIPYDYTGSSLAFDLYVLENIKYWVIQNGYNNRTLSGLLGVNYTLTTQYLSSATRRCSPWGMMLDFSHLGFKCHVDISHPLMKETLFPETIEKVMLLRPAVIDRPIDFMNINDKALNRRQVIAEVVEVISYNRSRDTELTESRSKLSTRVTRQLFDTRRKSYLTIDAFLQRIFDLGGDITFIINRFDRNPPSSFTYTPTGKSNIITRMISHARNYIKLSRYSIKKVCELRSLKYSTFCNLLYATPCNYGYITTFIDMLISLGMEVDIKIESKYLSETLVISMGKCIGTPLHECERPVPVDVIQKASDVRVKNGIDRNKIVNLIDFQTNECISKMQRGLIKTSMGETVRPFL